MESDDDFQTFSSPEEASSQSPARERKLKRLKKAVRVSQEPRLDQSDGNPLTPYANSSKSGAQGFQESDELLRSGSGSEGLCSGSILGSGFTYLGVEEDVSGAKRALDFDAVGDEIDENVVEDRRKEVQEESDDVRLEELEKKRSNPDDLGEEKYKKKKKRTDNSSFDGKPIDSAAIKRRTEKVSRLFTFCSFFFFFFRF